VKSLGLTAADQKLFTSGLLGNHSLEIQVEILNRGHVILSDISTMLMGGQVNVSATAEVTRSASLELKDPAHLLSFDTNSPQDAAMFMDRMIRVSYRVLSYDHLNRWVTIPIFTGPITKMNRSGIMVNVECMGKEHYAKKPAWRNKNYAIGTLRTSIVRELLVNVGETKFSIEAWDKRTANNYGVTRETDVWTLAKRMAAGRLLYYDGAGTLVMRAALARSVFTFGTGDGGAILNDPQIDYSSDSVKNIVWVIGGIPKGAKYPVQYTAYADRNHPMSAQKLGWNESAWHLPEKIEDPDLLSVSDCKERADAELTRLLRMYVNVSFDTIPIPHLECLDACTLSLDGLSIVFGLDDFSIPLKVGDSMTIGFNEMRSANVTKIRRKK